MSSDPSSAAPENDPNLSGLGRALLETGGSKPSSGPWVPPTAEELHAILPQYEIVKMLGRGGMGAVYMGRQISLDRPVAIKILSAQLEESDRGFTERFKNEARAMGKLTHPAVVAVYEFGQHESGLLYIVMEFVNGTDVAKMLAKSGRLHTEHAMAITAHVCDALAYAHERGIIHRDIKPANIMVGYDGNVKVADFGLAKVNMGGQTLGLTQSGMAMGTLQFMAPESLMLGKAVDHRADIYAVGVMLYQMLTGKLPQGMFKLPSLLVPGLDPRYDAIVRKALMEDRESRYQSIREMRAELDNILTQPVVKADPAASQARQPVLLTQSRVQRPGGKRVILTGAAPSVAPQPPPSSLAWLWVTALVVVVLGGVALLILTKEKPEFAQMDDATVTAGQPSASKAAPTTIPAESAKDRPFVNSLGMKFVPVPGTKVLFCIHETRRQDYAAFASKAPNVNGSWNSAQKEITSADKDTHPVVMMNWDDAQAFCAWLSKKEGRTYRLPTDQEWSYAVGIGDEEKWSRDTTPEMLNGMVKDQFPWGGEFPPKTSDRAGNYADTTYEEMFHNNNSISGYTDGFATTAPVMSFKPNNLGIHDLGGNVREWVEDWYNASQGGRVTRGGSWGWDEGRISREKFLSSFRRDCRPAMRYPHDGFRCVVEMPATTEVTPSEPQPIVTITKDTFTNSLGMKFVPVSGTKVSFCIHETRKSDYAKYAAENGQIDASWKTAENAGIPVSPKDDHPVVNVSWDDATAFCVWLSKKEGKQYRLPTDHEWSIAVGGLEQEMEGDSPAQKSAKIQGVHPWGGSLPPSAQDGNYSPRMVNDGYETTAPVMSFKVSKLGLYDLGGNVWEWCQDWNDSTRQERVIRGGSWGNYKPDDLLSSMRGPKAPGRRHNYLGFRCVVVDGKNGNESVVPSKPDAISQTVVPPPKITPGQSFTNSLGMKFVPVPGTMVHFCIHETRKADYAEYAATSSVDGSWQNVTAYGLPVSTADDHPVANVSWEDATAFCAWLSKKEGRPYRLPTDREWSYAAGIGSDESKDQTPAALNGKITDEFPWGKTWPPPQGAGNYADMSLKDKAPTRTVINGYTDGFAATAPVMSFSPNKLGLYDLGGNLWEWCEDWFNSEQQTRVLRGSGWSSPDHLLSSDRYQQAPDARRWHNGFRCVVEMTAASEVTPSEPQPSVTPTNGTLTNSLGMKFVPVPGTKVLFCIHETRKSDYAEFAAENGSVDGSWRKVTTYGLPVGITDHHPVTNVSREDAVAFCLWLSKREGENYRLPTDQEWSCASGIGQDEKEGQLPSILDGRIADEFPWGKTWPPTKGAGNYADTSVQGKLPQQGVIDDYTDGYETTAPVMSFRPNNLGIYDLGGNVWEWCSDWYNSEAIEGVRRGGSWSEHQRTRLLTSRRLRPRPSIRLNDLGFRVVLVVGSSAP